MNKNRFFYAVSKAALILGLIILPITAAAGELSAPQQVIEDTSNEVKLVLNRDRELLNSDPSYVYRLVDEVLVPHFDLNRISGLVLGRYWKRATDDEKSSFQYEFKRMLVRTYSTAIDQLDDWELTFLPSRQGKNENHVLVRTQIKRNGPPVAVDYRMQFKDDAWKVYDVKVEGMSLVTNYRSSFNRLIRTSGMSGLLSHLAQTNNEKDMADSEDLETQKVAHTN